MKAGTVSSRTIQLAVGSAIAVLLFAAAFSYRSIAASSESNPWVQHTWEVMDDLRDTTIGMATISSSIRRFVITGEESDLEPYHAARSEVERLTPVLRNATLDNPEQQRRLSILEKLAADRIERAE